MIAQRLDSEALDGDSALRESLLKLNNRSAIETSRLESGRLIELVAGAFAALHVPEAQALLITFNQNATYDSPNFLWFHEHYERFVYVDRIVVAESARGQNFARRLYHQLFDLAREAGHSTIVCEVNSNPPNPSSDAFHARMGFEQVGSAKLNKDKSVRYLLKALD